jgi:predicted RNase H-like HicB family nuclease
MEVFKMKNAYPVVMTQGKEFIVVFIPDFNINTQGKDVPEAIEMARDAIGLMGVDMQDDGEALPEASNLADIQSEALSGSIVSLVDVDFAEYRRKNDMRAVKKNCTIPSWLNFEAERAGVNFSAVLQAALKRELNIDDNILKTRAGV